MKIDLITLIVFWSDLLWVQVIEMDLNRDIDAYRDAGVSRDAAKTTVSFLSQIAKATYDNNVVEGVGGFGAVYLSLIHI